VGASSVYPLFFAVAILCYLAAVVIALPLGILGVVDAYLSLIPLGVGGVAMSLGMIAETRS
jgi:hypothetical protein